MGSRSAVPGPADLSLLLLLGLLTAIPYALTKIALETIPPVTMVAARVSLATIVLVIAAVAMRCEWPRRANLIPRLFVQGCLACALPYSLLAFGQLSVDSALTAILNSTTPIFVCLAGCLIARHDTLSRSRVAGVCIGLAGAVMIAGANALWGLGQSISGQTAIVLASVVSAASIIHGRQFADVSPIVVAVGSMTASAVVLVPVSFVVEAPLQCAPSAASLAALAINAIAATALGSIVYFRLIQTIGSMATASAGYLKPAIGTLIGAAFLGEALTSPAIAGLIAILLGVFLINRHRLQGSPAPSGAALLVQPRATN